VSKKGHARVPQPQPEGVTITETRATIVEALTPASAKEALQAVEAAASLPRPAGTDCTAFVTYDSLRWRCNCGASGRVGRTADGIPDTSGDILRHLPGVSKE
jgi:hypothetical protein